MLRNIWQKQKDATIQATLQINTATEQKTITTTAKYSLKLTIEGTIPEEKKLDSEGEDTKALGEDKSTEVIPSEVNAILDILTTGYFQAFIAGTYRQLPPLRTVVTALIRGYTPIQGSETSAFLFWRQHDYSIAVKTTTLTELNTREISLGTEPRP